MNYLLEKEVREHYFSIYLDQEPLDMAKFRTGDLIARFTDDLSSFLKLVGLRVVAFLGLLILW